MGCHVNKLFTLETLPSSASYIGQKQSMITFSDVHAVAGTEFIPYMEVENNVNKTSLLVR